jgi:hypothetical protein
VEAKTNEIVLLGCLKDKINFLRKKKWRYCWNVNAFSRKKLFCSLGLDPIPWTLSKKLKFERSQLTSTLSAYIHGRKQTRICLWGKFSHFLFSCPKSSDRKTEGTEREGQKDRKRDRERETETEKIALKWERGNLDKGKKLLPTLSML